MTILIGKSWQHIESSTRTCMDRRQLRRRVASSRSNARASRCAGRCTHGMHGEFRRGTRTRRTHRRDQGYEGARWPDGKNPEARAIPPLPVVHRHALCGCSFQHVYGLSSWATTGQPPRAASVLYNVADHRRSCRRSVTRPGRLAMNEGVRPERCPVNELPGFPNPSAGSRKQTGAPEAKHPRVSSPPPSCRALNSQCGCRARSAAGQQASPGLHQPERLASPCSARPRATSFNVTSASAIRATLPPPVHATLPRIHRHAPFACSLFVPWRLSEGGSSPRVIAGHHAFARRARPCRCSAMMTSALPAPPPSFRMPFERGGSVGGVGLFAFEVVGSAVDERDNVGVLFDRAAVSRRSES